MGEKKAIYGQLFSLLLELLKKYYSGAYAPMDEENRYLFFEEFHKDMGRLLEVGKKEPLAVSMYAVFCQSVSYGVMPEVREPGRMLSELWGIFVKWSEKKKPYSDAEKELLGKEMEIFYKKWDCEEIAIGFVIAVCGEASCI